MKIKKIAIVGAGTAGWLAANHLGSELQHEDIQITVIESDKVPTIGVGEGTVPYIMKGLERFGISEAELLISCDATFKQGIKFVNWMKPEQEKEHFYYHPFDSPYPAGFDISRHMSNLETSRPFDDVGIQARICELGLAPKRKSSAEYQGDLAYAYHFDAAKFAKLLANNAIKKFNVNHVIATILGAKKDSAGNITHLLTDEDSELAFDFYIDCSGFSSVLIEKELSVPFVKKDKELLTDTVLVQQVPISESEALNPYTTATAHKAGWVWDIPLTTRRGTGFVYSSQHMSETEAKACYAKYLGVNEKDFSPRKIPMDIGYRESFWQKNCVALGLAQGFLEPLEATSILLSDFSAEMLAKNFPRTFSDIDCSYQYYNKVVTYAWERTVDFIKLHYCLSDRDDSDFWQQNREKDALSAELIQRLNKFKLRPPLQSDFFSRFDLFNEKNFLYVLYGMNFNTQKAITSEKEQRHSEQLLEQNDQLVKQAANILLNHKEWLMALKAAMSER